MQPLCTHMHAHTLTHKGCHSHARRPYNVSKHTRAHVMQMFGVRHKNAVVGETNGCCSPGWGAWQCRHVCRRRRRLGADTARGCWWCWLPVGVQCGNVTDKADADVG